MTLFLALLLALSAHAGCDQVLAIALNHGEQGARTGDSVRVEGGLKDAQKSLGCAEGPIDSSTAARLHRLEAFGAWLRNNQARADLSLRAMVHADPWLGLGDLVASDHPISHRLMVIEEAGAGTTRRLLWPESGAVHVDGIPAAIAPQEHPWVYQQLTGEGAIVATGWIDAGAPTPTLIGDVGRRAQVANGWKLTGVTLGVAAGALYGAAWAQNKRYKNAVAAQDDVIIRDAYSKTRGLTVGSIVTGAAGGTFLVVGFAL